jgi:antitoxin component YwqK of YwqJK toxin-antitoxin module
MKILSSLVLLLPGVLLAQVNKNRSAAATSPPDSTRTVAFETFYAPGIPQCKGTYMVSCGTPPQEKVVNSDTNRVVLQGTFYEFFPDGTIKKKVEYLAGKKHGLLEMFYEDGSKLKTIGFKHNLQDGEYKEWHRNGTLKYHAVYESGLQNGLEIMWHDNGQLKSKIRYILGRKNGDALFYYPTGQLEMKAQYIEDVAFGTHTLYYPNNQKKAVYTFIDDIALLEFYWTEKGDILINNGTGVLKGVDPNKKQYFEETYVNGQKTGTAKYYYENGTLKQKGDFLENYEHGEWLFYNEHGELTSRAKFDRGVRTSQIKTKCKVD